MGGECPKGMGGRYSFLKILSCPPKYEFAPQMPPPNSEAWRRHCYRVAVRVYVWTKNTLMFQANALEDVEKVRSTNYGMSVLEIHYYIIPY
jgi:hypothetical protein